MWNPPKAAHGNCSWSIDLLRQYQTADGRWRNQVRHSGKIFFTLEPGREPSRWNTLCSLRELRWWDQGI
jgi:hypothetical protein